MIESKDSEVMLDLFLHPGWKKLHAELEEAHKILVETAWQLTDERALYKRKGEIQQLVAILNTETMVRMNESTE